MSSLVPVCLTMPKFLKFYFNKGSKALGQAKSLFFFFLQCFSEKELPGFIEACMFIYYVGLKNSYVDTSPSVYASCWLSCFPFMGAPGLSCEADMCLCSAQREL